MKLNNKFSFKFKSLIKISKFKDKIQKFKKNNICVFGLLLFLTISIYFVCWPLMYFTEGSLLNNGDILISQYKNYSIKMDGGYFEHFQYILLIWCSTLSFLIYLRQNKFTLPIPIIYLFLFINEALNIHDSVFHKLLVPLIQKTILNSISFVSIETCAELIYWTLIGFLFILISYPSFRFGDHGAKKFIKNNFKLIALLAFFGIFIDLFTEILSVISPLNRESYNSIIMHGSFIALEEVGEIAMIAIICIWLYDCVLNKKLIK